MGSSPLTRGKHDGVPRRHHSRGFIPARAGKTLHDPAHRSASTAHPHAGEENYAPPCGKLLMSGSSPLTRGKHSIPGPRAGVKGLIPAHAGKTDLLGSVRKYLPGSSPLTRGKRSALDSDRACVGLIPARAGKTFSRPSRRVRGRAHPRAGGENEATLRLP